MESLLNPEELANVLGISKAQVWNLIRDGRLPEPIYLGQRQPRWRPESIEEFLSLQELTDVFHGFTNII